MSVPQAPHTVPFVCTGCLGIEDFTAYAMCLPRYPFLGHHQAHPVLMPGAREPGQQMRPGPSPGADLVALFCPVPSLCSGAPDAGDLGSVRVQGWTPGTAQLLATGLRRGAEPFQLLFVSWSHPSHHRQDQTVWTGSSLHVGQCHCSPLFPGTVSL